MVKKQIRRLSPHQNAKVFAVLMALGSLVFVIPFLLFASIAAPQGKGPPLFMFVLFPVMYLVFGYVAVVVGCWLYNVLFKYLGGIEYEAADVDA